ncbi:MAG: hypothetical protein HZC03_02610 [Candidatus Lloydbacteria bacterium]|nr:hypothetical protein [Candidatus Lloydbacteria bacterium]
MMPVRNYWKRFTVSNARFFSYRTTGFIVTAFVAASLIVSFILPALHKLTYEQTPPSIAAVSEAPKEKEAPVFQVTHIQTPQIVRAVYMTSWVAGTHSLRDHVVSLINDTELNAVVIDIKDYSGHIAFPVDDTAVSKYGASENRFPDVRAFIGELHKKNIYVIGRITVFQDPFLAKTRPDLAVKKESDKNALWKDYKGLSYIDPGAEEGWKYIAALARASYALGFDELNFDYIRFPSDGNMRDIYFTHSEAHMSADTSLGKADVLRGFFRFLRESLSDIHEKGAMLSADLFGMTTTNTDDLNIGQILEYAEPSFDYIAPMVYPSHYPSGFHGYANPNEHAYEVVKYSMDSAATRLIAASSTPNKLRPWLQDFNYGGTYDSAKVRAQIQATYDAGLSSWMLWDPANKYTRDALLAK